MMKKVRVWKELKVRMGARLGFSFELGLKEKERWGM